MGENFNYFLKLTKKKKIKAPNNELRNSWPCVYIIYIYIISLQATAVWFVAVMLSK